MTVTVTAPVMANGVYLEALWLLFLSKVRERDTTGIDVTKLPPEPSFPPLTTRTLHFFLRGSVIPFPVGFFYRQVAIRLLLLGITVIISPPHH
jgi:hypothetical protein